LRGIGFTAGAALLAACASAGSPAASSGGVTVTDQRGQRIVLARPATRIVTIVIPAAALLIALDSGVSRLVGVNSSAAQATQDGILGEIFPDASRIQGDVADQSFAPNVESIVGLNPDVVVSGGIAAGRSSSHSATRDSPWSASATAHRPTWRHGSACSVR
jgi:iron complex transport system substrate-binding protein